MEDGRYRGDSEWDQTRQSRGGYDSQVGYGQSDRSGLGGGPSSQAIGRWGRGESADYSQQRYAGSYGLGRGGQRGEEQGESFGSKLGRLLREGPEGLSTVRRAHQGRAQRSTRGARRYRCLRDHGHGDLRRSHARGHRPRPLDEADGRRRRRRHRRGQAGAQPPAHRAGQRFRNVGFLVKRRKHFVRFVVRNHVRLSVRNIGFRKVSFAQRRLILRRTAPSGKAPRAFGAPFIFAAFAGTPLAGHISSVRGVRARGRSHRPVGQERPA